jgi:Fe-S cluster assembly iron-binding protein IscA
MLTLTPTATEAVRHIVARAPVDDDTGGLRIAPGEPAEPGASLQMTLVDGPEAADQDISDGDAHVYIDPRAAEVLDDKVLDAEVRDGSIAFGVRDADTRDDQQGQDAP